MGSNFELSWAKLGTSDRQYVIVHLHDGRKYRFRVPKGSFLSPQQLERGIHHGMIAEVERLLTRKRSAPVHASFGNGDDDEEEGEILDVSFVEEEEETGEAPLHPLSNLTKLSAEQETLRHEKLAQEERRQREEEQRKQREAERKRREEEERRRKTEEDRRKAAEKAAREKKAKEEKEASEKKAREEKLAREKNEEQRIAKEKKREKEALGKKAEEERLAKAEAERVALETKAEEERVTKAEEERVANETKKKQEEKQTAELQRQQLATRKQKELELLKEFRPWRGGYMRLLHGKDPTPDYRVRHSELPWEAPEFNPSAHIQQNIGEFRELFEQEVYDENYGVKTREEKEELIELVKGFRFYFTEQIGRFELKVFNGKISHITLTDQLAYVLGYEQEQEIRNEELAKYAVDLGGGVSHLCIYLNSGVIESMIVGNTFANLLQVIAVEGKSGSVVEKDFQSPLFHKIIAREVDVLDVEIRTLTGREVPFEFGQVVLTLQFKKQVYQQNGGGVSVFEGAPTFQRGYGYFLGVPRQKGAGVGSVLRNLWRYLRPMVSAARPYAANIAAEIGKEGLETGARFLNEVSKGGNIKDALVSEGKEGAKNLLDKASSSLQKGRGRKKRRGGRKKAEIILKPSDVIHPITSYVDLSKVFVCTEFNLKKVADDGVVVDCRQTLRSREVYYSNQLYSYKVFMDTELSYPVAAKEAYFGVAGYFRDSDPTKVNDKRKKAVEESKSFKRSAS
ncbi:hypothetical protein niasHT_003181 [Heterodera trifolii]|uniref:Uncharacterized protein n=1 Tax=Heterodera trifolii TaxID=157864 RepID=A0ABD2MDL2_9BILA